MRRFAFLLILGPLLVGRVAAGSDVIVRVSDPDGAAARAAAPISVSIDFEKLFGARVATGGWRLTEIDGDGQPVNPPVTVRTQFEPDEPDSREGTLWWIMPTGAQHERRFGLTLVKGKFPPVWQVERDSRRQSIDVIELAWPPPARP
ncbi:MAG: hypothetical protein HQ582_22320, partial [Planctomycetes bacterium]|nr:hypothetical protein [Planctomycetota bacterium]